MYQYLTANAGQSTEIAVMQDELARITGCQKVEIAKVLHEKFGCMKREGRYCIPEAGQIWMTD